MRPSLSTSTTPKRDSFFGSDLDGGEGDVGGGVLVLLHHLAVIHFVDVIAGENEDVLGLLGADGINVLVNRVGRALIPLIADALHGRKDFDELSDFAAQDVPAFADVAVQRQSFVLGEDVDAAQVGVEAVGESDVDDAIHSTEGDGGLGAIAGERIKALSGATGEKDSESVFHGTPGKTVDGSTGKLPRARRTGPYNAGHEDGSAFDASF